MPNCGGVSFISTSAQVAPGAINSEDILNDSIKNEDIKSDAAIAGSKIQALNVGANAGVIPDTGVENAHVKAAAGIVDTKLAEISTANKVNGTSFKNLAGIPAGAGVIPSANLPATSVTYKNGTAQKDISEASAVQNIAHGLGAIPKKVSIIAMIVSGASDWNYSRTVYNGTTQSTLSLFRGGSTTIQTTFVLNNSSSGNVGDTDCTGVVTFDATNIIITWTKTGSPTGTYKLLWEAEV